MRGDLRDHNKKVRGRLKIWHKAIDQPIEAQDLQNPPLSADSLRALYNKYRPQKFADVAGQQHVVRILQNALRFNRVSHAYLFSGERGTGKTTVGRILAKALNCQRGIQPEPCNQCEHCRSVGNESFLDLIEIDAASHTSVNDIRDLREKVRYRPAAGRFKVYLIDEVHQLSRSAYNAFLKTLEEPPDHAVFILATTDPHRVLPTVRSRCQHLRFRRIGHRQIVDQLLLIVELEAATAEDEALSLIARNAEGSLRDALGLLEQGLAYADNALTERHMRELLGSAGYEGVTAIASAIARGELSDAMDALLAALSDGADPLALQQQLVGFFRAVLLLLASRRRVELGQYSGDELEVLGEIAGHFSRIRQPLAVVEALTERPPATASRPPQLDLEMAIAQAAIAAGAEDLIKPSTAPTRRQLEPHPPTAVVGSGGGDKPDAAAQGPEPAAAPTASQATPEPPMGQAPAGAELLALFAANRPRFEELVRAMDPSLSNVIAQAGVEAQSDGLVLSIDQKFAYDRLSQPSVIGKLSDLASQALNVAVAVRLTLVSRSRADAAYTEKLASFAADKFGAQRLG